MTYPRSTSGIGFWTSLDTKASHAPRTPETSKPVELTIESMSAECPIVPTKIGRDPLGTVEFTGIVRLARVGLTPVTLWMSATKSPAARCTPGQSSGETKTGAACWPLITGKVSLLDWKATQEGAPIDPCTTSKLARSAKRRDKARVPWSAILSSSQDSVWYISSFLYYLDDLAKYFRDNYRLKRGSISATMNGKAFRDHSAVRTKIRSQSYSWPFPSYRTSILEPWFTWSWQPTHLMSFARPW